MEFCLLLDFLFANPATGTPIALDLGHLAKASLNYCIQRHPNQDHESHSISLRLPPKNLQQRVLSCPLVMIMIMMIMISCSKVCSRLLLLRLSITVTLSCSLWQHAGRSWPGLPVGIQTLILEFEFLGLYINS